MEKHPLTIEALCEQAKEFSALESNHTESRLYGVTDGKAIGTYLEHKFRDYLGQRFLFAQGNSASGIDFPDILVDMKVTSITQPQSSCPFKSARQKIFGLGYSLLIFVYDKHDDIVNQTATLTIVHCLFVNAQQTGDFQMTRGLRNILANDGNKDDLIAFMQEKNLPLDEIELDTIADDLLKSPPEQGFLTISNALQWRLQYSRVIEKAGGEAGILLIHRL